MLNDGATDRIYNLSKIIGKPMEQNRQLKTGLIIALVFAIFFACMLGYFIAVKNLLMSIVSGLMVISSCTRSIQLYKKIKDK